MHEILLFCQLLRQAGLSVAPSEIADAVNGLILLDAHSNSPMHRTVLNGALVKRGEDQGVFDLLYELFFHFANYSSCQEQAQGNKGRCDSNQRAFAGGEGSKASGLPSLALALEKGDFAPCSGDLQRAVGSCCQLDLPVDEIVRQALVRLDYFGAVNSLRLRRERGIITEWDYHSAMENSLNFVQLVRKQVLKHLLEKSFAWNRVAEEANWRAKSFDRLTTEELRVVKNYVSKIGRRLATRPGGKFKISSMGDITLPGTAHRAMVTGGKVCQFVYTRRIPARPELILLCDVSNSVYRFTGFMLQLVAAFKEKFHNIRIFTFVDTLWEFSRTGLNGDVETIIEDIRANNRCSISGLSDFGKVFWQFSREVLPQLGPRCTIVVLGDARNNWRPPELEAFKEIRSRIRKLYWLNPLPHYQWGQEDCLMQIYSPYCTGVFACGNITQLEQIAARIF